ncbi:hypothetical protein GCM10022280_24720 [Sphingomonas swuensis]|uniref:Uncharacterized protein n=1 Tax=Sphingomonas swuensis TaxID=977800 RepID=A0ABP7T9L6_9SPHN
MQRLIIAALAAAAAVPAAAQPYPQPYPPAPPPAASLPPEIADGRTIDQLGNMVGALTRALLELPVGEVEAAIENRPVTSADRRKTVRSVTGTDERELGEQIEESKVAVKQGGAAVARSLPVIRDALNRAGDEIARATANVPQPGYPRR